MQDSDCSIGHRKGEGEGRKKKRSGKMGVKCRVSDHCDGRVILAQAVLIELNTVRTNMDAVTDAGGTIDQRVIRCVQAIQVAYG